MGKHEKKIKQKSAAQGDLPVAEVVKLLKEEILEEVRLVSNGRKNSVYELVEKGKELMALEDQLAASLPPPNQQSPAKSDSALANEF